MKKVSVIMPVYNCEKTVKEAIDSILAQTYKNIELIICDDASTDNTAKIVGEYAEKYPEIIKFIKNEKNSKLHFSLNHCLEYVTGEYVARMDGDDISMPTRFEKQVEFLDGHPECDEVGSAYIRFDEEGEFGILVAPSRHNKFQMKHTVPSCHACIMMRKEVYDRIGGYTVSKRTERCEDVDMWFKFYANGYIGANIEENLYKVRENRNTLNRRKLRYSVDATVINFKGYRALKYPIYWYPLVLRPIVSYFTPFKLKVLYRSLQAKKQSEVK